MGILFSGLLIITYNNGSTIPSWTRLGIGINPTRDDESGGNPCETTCYRPKALTDAQLQLLSTLKQMATNINNPQDIPLNQFLGEMAFMDN